MSTDGLGSWNWKGNPGIRQSDIWTLGNYVGDTFLIPLFAPEPEFQQKILVDNPARLFGFDE